MVQGSILREKVLAKETTFEEQINSLSINIRVVHSMMRMLSGTLKKKNSIRSIWSLRFVFRSLDDIHDFLLKYDMFLKTLDKKFGTSLMECIKSSKKIVGEMKKEIQQVIIFISRKEFEIAHDILEKIKNNQKSLSKNLEDIVMLPNTIDYSKLSNRDWKMIGVAGIHYRSKVFLSYHFRDDNPKEDENQKMIDYYIKPTLELLNIEPVTARDKLKSQELIDDKSVELIKDCDGIIGFYTKGDSVGNVEHELSTSHNVVAICREAGAKAPSMRLSRLQINFKRSGMGEFLIEMIRALKDKGLFRLMV